MAMALLQSFNRGLISPLALARTDFKRTALSAETMTNWMPRALGSMMLRPGLGYKGATKDNARSITIPFIFAVDDTARLEFTDSVMRVWVDDALVTRASVTTSITNGTFATDITGWTDLDTGTSVSDWVTGYMRLDGTGTGQARRRQQITVSGGNIGTRHALDIVVPRGPVSIRVGSTAGGDEYVTETSLGTGNHSLAFTPTGDFYIDLFNSNQYAALVDSVAIASSGTMEIETPWLEDDLANMRWDQSGDIVFVACTGHRQRKIERRGDDSWSVCVYQSDDGPFMIQNTGPITLTPTGLTSDTDLTSSASFFRPEHVGSLFKLTQTGQRAAVEITGEDQYSDPIRVTGVDGTRSFAIIITGTWAATLTLQYSVGEVGSWVDATSGTYTANTSISYDDTLDNQVIYYRIGCKAGNYTSGTASAQLSSSSGSQTGIARVTSYQSETIANVQVLSAFAKTTATTDWAESYWSDYRGYPSAVAFYEGRLWWVGKDRIWGSVSDSFYSYDDEYEGDAGPINRSIGSGPVDTIYWLLPMQRLLLGAGGRIWSARSSSLDEPLTPTNFNLKPISGQGAASVGGVALDTNAAFVQRSGTRLFEAAYSADVYDYQASDLAAHVPEVGEPSIVRLAVQRQPETRLHCVLSDGTVAILVYDKVEEVQAWVKFETDGIVEDIVVEPGVIEDKVTYTIARTIDGNTVRYHERWALESECTGGTLNKQADSFVSATGSGSSITGLSHLEGETVVVWADGVYQGEATVAAGEIAQAYVDGYVVGMPYTATWKSTKLAYGTADYQTALCAKKRISKLGIIARNIHPAGLKYGPDFDLMDDLPYVERGTTVDTAAVHETYDEEMFAFAGNWDTDSRLCLKAVAPKPVTILACVVNIDTNVSD